MVYTECRSRLREWGSSRTSTSLIAELREQYGCGPVRFAGDDDALFERHLVRPFRGDEGAEGDDERSVGRRAFMYGGTIRITASRGGAVALAIALMAGLPQLVRAADDFEKIHAEAGRQWYDKYCMPCHGAGGAPGSAVYPDTKKPVDLRDYVERHGGKFPAAQWISVVTTDNPALVHTEVWHKIRDSQGGATSSAAGRSIVAAIASYVRSIQR